MSDEEKMSDAKRFLQEEVPQDAALDSLVTKTPTDVFGRP